jgi:hypothetical protein
MNMAIRQTRVFVRSDEPNDDWAETLIGRVFGPLTAEFAASLQWCWFPRYVSPADESGDCEIAQIPAEYKEGGLHRSMRFRFSIADADQASFERRGQELVSSNGYQVFDFRAYDHVADRGNNRFLGTEYRHDGRNELRALLITHFFMAVSRLTIDALVGPSEQGRFRLESNDDQLQNPRGSTFQSLLHLFCNITNVPTDVYLFHKPGLNLLGYGTFIYPPPNPPGGWDHVAAYPIRY